MDKFNKNYIIYLIPLLICIFVITNCANPQTNPNYNLPINQQELAKIQEGMSLVEAKKIIGSPTIQDIFTKNKLIYLFLVDSKEYQLIITIDEKNVIEKVEKRFVKNG